MNKRHYEHTLPNIRGSLSNTYEKMERMLSVMEDVPRSLFNGERFLTDEELSKVLRVSRRTLQEYRTFGVIPYYLVQGKALYKESDIMKILDDAYKRCREEQRWV